MESKTEIVYTGVHHREVDFSEVAHPGGLDGRDQQVSNYLSM